MRARLILLLGLVSWGLAAQTLEPKPGNAGLAGAVTRTQQERQPLAQAIQAAFVPVIHTLVIEPR